MSDLVSFGEFELPELPELPEDMWWEIIRQSLSSVWLFVNTTSYKICQKIIRETKESPIDAVRRGNLLMLPMIKGVHDIAIINVFDSIIRDYYFDSIVLHFTYLFNLRWLFRRSMEINYRWKEIYTAIEKSHEYPLNKSDYRKFLVGKNPGMPIDEFNKKFGDSINARQYNNKTIQYLHYVDTESVYAQNIDAVRHFKKDVNLYFNRSECLSIALRANWYDGVVEFNGSYFDQMWGLCNELEIARPIQDLVKDTFCLHCKELCVIHFEDFKPILKECGNCRNSFKAHPESKTLCYNCLKCVISYCEQFREPGSVFCKRDTQCICYVCRNDFPRPTSFRGSRFKCQNCRRLSTS